jgi:hypothetical protein
MNDGMQKFVVLASPPTKISRTPSVIPAMFAPTWKAQPGQPHCRDDENEVSLRARVGEGSRIGQISHSVVVEKIERVERKEDAHRRDCGKGPQHSRRHQRHTDQRDQRAKRVGPSHPWRKFGERLIVESAKALSFKATPDGWIHRHFMPLSVA